MIEQVHQDIFRICVPIPFPLRTVNMHALVGKDGWALVDTGMGTPDARAAFAQGLESAGLELEQLQAIVLTHHHPDHIGLSGELHKRTGAKVYMHPIDERSVQIIWSGTMPHRFGYVSHFFQQHGLPQTQLWMNNVEPGEVSSLINAPPHEAFTLVEDGETLDLVGKQYQVIWTPGHSDGQICLFRPRDGVFLAADHVLPRITPNIGLYTGRDRPNPLSDYLDSLAKVASLPATSVLPGHGEPFANLAGRTAEIAKHHEERLGLLSAMLRERPQNAYQLAMQLFGDRLKSDEARRMGVAEVIAHLEYMRLSPNGHLVQQRTSDDMILYAPTDF